MRFGIWEIVLILAVVLVLFGGSKLAGVGKALGRSIKDFKEEVAPEKKAATAEADAAVIEPSIDVSSEKTLEVKEAPKDPIA